MGLIKIPLVQHVLSAHVLKGGHGEFHLTPAFPQPVRDIVPAPDTREAGEEGGEINCYKS